MNETPEKLDGETVDAEFIDIETDSEITAAPVREISTSNERTPETEAAIRRAYITYILIPLVFMAVTILGGLRLNGLDNSFIFLKPALFCLIFAAILMVLFFRSGLLDVTGWFSEDLAIRHNVANGAVIASLFAASVQVFNSLIPEQGLPFWVVAFCFFWTLLSYLFADIEPAKLLRSLGALLGFAFFAKYLLLANLTAPAGESWLRSIIENPGREAFTWALDLPRFAAGTGYIQFFTVILYLFGLYLLPRMANRRDV